METNTIKEEDKLSVNESVPNTPFRVIGNEIKGYAIAIGKFALTETVPTITEAHNLLQSHIWIIITNLILAMPDILKDIENLVGLENPIPTKSKTKKESL